LAGVGCETRFAIHPALVRGGHNRGVVGHGPDHRMLVEECERRLLRSLTREQLSQRAQSIAAVRSRYFTGSSTISFG
jgi:hypothetical protein